MDIHEALKQLQAAANSDLSAEEKYGESMAILIAVHNKGVRDAVSNS